MAYIKSKDIQLFPSAFRGKYSSSEGGTVFNPGSRLTTEYNLTSLVSRVSKEHLSYVVRYDKTATDKDIIISILGYQFALKMTGYLSLFTNNIWVKIKLENIASDDSPYTNTLETKPILKPLNGGTVLDEGTETGEFFGIELSETEPSVALGEYKLHILEKTGDWDVPAKSYFRMSAKEISDATNTNKSINEEFNTKDLTVTKINKITITPPSNTSTLTIEDGKTLTVKDDVTLAGTGTATFNKNLTVAGTHNITLETAGADRTLKVSGSNKELAGAGSVLTMGGNLTTIGAHTTTFTTTGNTTITLPVTGTLATLNGLETLKQKTLESPILITPTLGVATATKLNGLTIDTTTGTLDIADSKTLAVNESITLTADQARTLTINGNDKTLTGNGTTLNLRNNFTTGTHIITLNTTATTNITLPTTGTLATIAGTESLTNKTVNGLTLTSKATGFEISGGTTSKKLTIADTVNVGANVTVVEPINIQAPLYVDFATTIKSPLNVGTTHATGTVNISSPSADETTIIGPEQEGTAYLIAGIYTNSATTANSESATASTLVKRTSAGNISANIVYASSVNASAFNGKATSASTANNVSATINNVALSTIFESNYTTVKNATNATKTSFTNNGTWWSVYVAPNSSAVATNMNLGYSYEMYIVQSGTETIRRHLGIITLPNHINFEINSSPYAGSRYLKIEGNSGGGICSSSEGTLGFTLYYRRIN